MARTGVTATFTGSKALALWIRVDGLSSAKTTARRIAKLKDKVPSNVRDYVVVYGRRLNDHNNEVMVIVPVNQPTADVKAFAEFTAVVRAGLKGAFREVDFPEEALCDPLTILEDGNFNGWTAVKQK